MEDPRAIIPKSTIPIGKRYTITCRNVPKELLINKTASKEYFQQYGRVLRMVNRVRQKTCTVEYDTEEAAKAAYLAGGLYNDMAFSIEFQSPEKVSKIPSLMSQKGPVWSHDSDVLDELNAMSDKYPTCHKALMPTEDLMDYDNPPTKKTAKARVKSKTAVVRSADKVKSRVKKVVPNVISKVPSIDPLQVAELMTIINQGATNVDEKYRILEARDKLIRLHSTKSADFSTASKTVGTCPDMCPEKERLMRESQHQVAVYEQTTNVKGEICMNHKIAIKQYSRSSADQEIPLAHELRPVPILQHTMSYLLHTIMDLCDSPDVNIGEWFHFLWDRTRGIRKDITQQDLCCPGTVELVEQCARFHIHCSASLAGEDVSVFDQKINTENLTKCLQTLKYMYHDLELKKVFSPNEAEFRGYIILLNLHDGNFMWEVKQLRPEIQKSSPINFAIKVYSALDNNNHVSFFKLVRSTTYLNACILLRYFNQVRFRTMDRMIRTHSPRAMMTEIALSELQHNLAFEDVNGTISFLEYHGLNLNESQTHVILNRLRFEQPQVPYSVERAINIIESKRNVSVGEVICGKTLPPKLFENHIPHDSFTNGFLNKSEIDEKWQGNLKTTFERPITPKPENSKPSKIFPEVGIKAERKSEPQSQIFAIKQIFGAQSQKTVDAVDAISSTEPPIVSAIQPIFTTATNKTNIFGGVATQITSPSAINTNIFSNQSATRPFGASKPVQSFQNPFNNQGNAETALFQLKQDPIVSNTPSNVPPLLKTAPLAQIPGGIFANFPPKPAGLNDFTRNPRTKGLFETEFAPKEQHQVKPLVFSSSKYEPPKQEIDRMHELLQQQALEQERQRIFEEEKRVERERQMEAAQKVEAEFLAKQVALKQAEIAKQQKLLREERMRQEEARQEAELRANILKQMEIKRKNEELRKREALERQVSVQCLIDKMIDDVVEMEKTRKLATIAENLKRLNLLRLGRSWRDKVHVRNRKRKAVADSPVWISNRTNIEEANELYSANQSLVLQNMKRYKLGRDREFCTPDDSIRTKIDLTQKVYGNLKLAVERQQKCMVNTIDWKVVFSLPDFRESNIHVDKINKILRTAFENCPSSEADQKYLLIDSLQPNSSDVLNVSFLCVDGYNSKQIHEKTDLFFIGMNDTKSVHTLKNRLQLLISNVKYNPITVVVLLRKGLYPLEEEYLLEQLEIEEMENEQINYKIICDNGGSSQKFITAIEEGLCWLAKNTSLYPPLQMDELGTVLFDCLGDTFVKRVEVTTHRNLPLKLSLSQVNVSIELYNNAITRLSNILLDDANLAYPDFPQDLKQFRKFVSYPCNYEHFPTYWKKATFRNEIQNLLNTLFLPKFSEKWPPTEMSDLEDTIERYCVKVIGGESAERVFLKMLCHILDYTENEHDGDFQVQMEHFPWMQVVEILMVHKLHGVVQKNIPFEKIVVYDKVNLRKFQSIPWWLDLDIIKTNVRYMASQIPEPEQVPVEVVPQFAEEAISFDIDSKLAEVTVFDFERGSRLAETKRDVSEFRNILDDLSKTIDLHKQTILKFDEILQHELTE